MVAKVKRREFITLAGGWAVAWPAALRAQQRVPRAGIVWILSEPLVPKPVREAFHQGLRELGYVEGRTINLEERFGEGKLELLPGLAQELVRLKVDVLVAPATPVLRAMREASTSIPIVMGNVSDPVGLGFVASLRRPGGNITGFANLTVEQVGKNVELCKEALPHLSRLAVLVLPAFPEAAAVVQAAQAAAASLGFEIRPLEARRPDDLNRVVAEAIEHRSEALLVSTMEGIVFGNRHRILEPAAEGRLPVVLATTTLGAGGGGALEAGALLAYGASSPEMLRGAAGYVDRILKGANPAELPVQQPSKFSLAVNLRTARTLGIAIPPSILVRADEVIE